MFTNSETLFNHAAEMRQAIALQESVRKGQLKKLLLCVALVAAVLLAVLYYQLRTNPESFTLLDFSFVIGVVFLLYIYSKAKLENKLHYKREIVRWLLGIACKQVGCSSDNGITYEPSCNAPQVHFNGNPLFKKGGNRVDRKDLFYGNVNGREFQLYEAYFYYEMEVKPYWCFSRFKGIVFSIGCGCGSHAATAITNDGLHGGNKGMFLKVKLGETPLANTFCVYATDVDWAQQLLSPAMQSGIMNLSFRTKGIRSGNMKILFRKNNMEVYLPSKVPHFQPKLFRRTTSQMLEADYEVLVTLLGLV